ncbi:MAG: hypothetical protein H0X24_08820 [Ktedonobacterales bacterium]|nr:hypothetical protein [Ktedonobacterales bacterium]
MEYAITEGQTASAHLTALGDLALARHAAQQATHPKRAAVAFLRVALTCARELARHIRFHPELRLVALSLVERVVAGAQAAEADCFAAGGNSAPYISVLVAAAGLRLQLADMVIHETRRTTDSSDFGHQYPAYHMAEFAHREGAKISGPALGIVPAPAPPPYDPLGLFRARAADAGG